MAVQHSFWDSCVLIAYLNNDEAAYDIDSLRTFIPELGQKDGCVIYTSAIALAEITPKRLSGSDFDAFHTYDNGRGKGNPEGKGISLLGFHEWLEGVEGVEIADRVVAMNRCRPIHNQPGFKV